MCLLVKGTAADTCSPITRMPFGWHPMATFFNSTHWKNCNIIGLLFPPQYVGFLLKGLQGLAPDYVCMFYSELYHV